MHTEEPWIAGVWEGEKNPQILCEDSLDLIAKVRLEDYAHRITACVNGCKGINPESVPDMLAALLCVDSHLEFRQGLAGRFDLMTRDERSDIKKAIAKARTP